MGVLEKKEALFVANKTTSRRAARRGSGFLAKILLVVLLTAVGWQLHSLRTQVKAAQAEQAAYAEQVAARQQENEALRSDMESGNTEEKMEEIARNELDWTFSNEYVFYDKRS